MHRSTLIALCLSCLLYSCKPEPVTKGDPCGDPPPVAEAPRMRVFDKATGRDYFIKYTNMKGSLAIKRFCSDQPVVIGYNELKKDNGIYGYGISFSYMPLLAGADSCKSVSWTWLGSDVDTLTYYTHAGACSQMLDSILYNGVKLKELVDTFSSKGDIYYVVLK